VKALRLLLGATGVVLIAVGVVFLSDDPFGDLVGVGAWLAGGVVAHDAVIAPLVIVVGALGVPRLPRAFRAPAVVGLVVLMTVTLMAVPVIGRFGAKADDHGLLDRPYVALWLAFAALVVVAVVIASLLRRRPPRIG
jgi:hypothetical protein